MAAERRTRRKEHINSTGELIWAKAAAAAVQQRDALHAVPYAAEKAHTYWNGGGGGDGKDSNSINDGVY